MKCTAPLLTVLLLGAPAAFAQATIPELRIEGVPPGATVLFDGVPVEAPEYVLRDVATGRHVLEATAPGHAPTRLEVELSLDDVALELYPLDPRRRQLIAVSFVPYNLLAPVGPLIGGEYFYRLGDRLWLGGRLFAISPYVINHEGVELAASYFETGLLARYELAPRSPGIFAGAAVVGGVSVLPWIVDRDVRRGLWSEYTAVGPLLALELTFPHVRAFLELKKPLFSEDRLRDYHVMVQLGVGGFFEL